jgi:hypothetical protein
MEKDVLAEALTKLIEQSNRIEAKEDARNEQVHRGADKMQAAMGKVDATLAHIDKSISQTTLEVQGARAAMDRFREQVMSELAQLESRMEMRVDQKLAALRAEFIEIFGTLDQKLADVDRRVSARTEPKP